MVSKTADEIGLQITKIHFWTNWYLSQTLRIFKIRSKRRNGQIIRKNWIDNASGMYFNNFFLDFFYISFTQIIYYFFFFFIAGQNLVSKPKTKGQKIQTEQLTKLTQPFCGLNPLLKLWSSFWILVSILKNLAPKTIFYFL